MPIKAPMGPSLNYVSIFEGGRGQKMLTYAYVGEGGVFEMLMLSIMITYPNENFHKTPFKAIYRISCSLPN